MTISVTSFNGNAIGSGNYRAWFDEQDDPYAHAISPVLVRPAGRNPRHPRSNIAERMIRVFINIASGTYAAGQAELAGWFPLGTSGELVVAYEGVNRALTATVTAFNPYRGSPNIAVATLLATDPQWHSAALQTVTQQVTSSATFAVANDGNVPDYRPVITLQPKTAKSAGNGYTFRRRLVVANRVSREFNACAFMFTIDHAALTTVKSQADGDDLRVRVDGKEVPRWVNTSGGRTWDTATCDVWFPLHLSPAFPATLLTAFASGVSPANGADAEVVAGGTDGFNPAGGVIQIENETLAYTGLTKRNSNGREAFTGITRGHWGSTAAAHSAAVSIYPVEHDVEVVYGHTGATAPDARDDLKPMLDFTDAGLSNTSWRWLDMADLSKPNRLMQWVRRLVTSRDDQAAMFQAPSGSPAAAMSLVFSSTGPAVGSPNFNQWERDFPSGTDGNIAPTRVVDASLGLQYITVDADGNELRGTIANDGLQLGPLTSAADAHDPGDVYGIRLWAFNQVIAASGGTYPTNDVGDFITSSENDGFRITVGDQPLMATSFSVYVDPPAAVRTITAKLKNDANGTLVTLPTVNTDGTTNVQEITFTFSTPYQLQPGLTYRIEFSEPTGDVVLIWTSAPYPVQHRMNGTAISTWSVNFRLRGYPAPTATSFVRCDDNALATDGDAATVTSIIVPLLSTGVPYFNLLPEESAVYHLSGVLENTDTGQTATLDIICVDEDEIEIDVGARTVRNVTKGQNVLAGVTFSDKDEWIRLAPGANDVRYVEAGITRVDVTVESYDRWQ